MHAPKTLIGALVLALAAAPAAADSSALERLHNAVESAWRNAPDLEVRRAELTAAAAEHRAEAAAGSPMVEWQREGIGSSFTNRDNAQTTLRLGAPFVPPWEWGDVRAVNRDAGLFTEDGIRAARHDLAARVATDWLQLAATLDELEVARGRLERLEQAVTLQTHRRDLGEVAGIEVVQLELERLREAGHVHQLQSGVAAARARLVELAGPDAPLPVAGDLVTLVGLPSTLPPAADLEARIADGPLARAATAQARVMASRAGLLSEAAWGRPEAEAEWERFPALDGIPGYDAAGVRVSWPLPLGRAGRERAAAARATAAAATASAAVTLRELERRARTASAAADNAARVLAEAEPVMASLGSAERSLAEQFRLGAVSYLVYIDGLSRLDDVRTQVIGARLDLLTARVDLARVLGSGSAFPLPEVSP